MERTSNSWSDRFRKGPGCNKDCKNNQQAEKSINQANIALGRMRKTLKLNFLM